MDSQSRAEGRFNVSRWALEHPALTRYLLVVLMLLGFAAYFQLGQDEDPPFTFRAMVVQASWPGATAQQVAEQVTDKIEKALQEVPYADKVSSYTKPGESLTILQLKDSLPPREVPNSWYQARKRIGDIRFTLPAGVVGPFFNDDFGDVYAVVYAFTSDGLAPPIGASEPGQKNDAATMPCFSAVVQIGSPRYQDGSRTASESDIPKPAPRASLSELQVSRTTRSP